MARTSMLHMLDGVQGPGARVATWWVECRASRKAMCGACGMLLWRECVTNSVTLLCNVVQCASAL